MLISSAVIIGMFRSDNLDDPFTILLWERWNAIFKMSSHSDRLLILKMALVQKEYVLHKSYVDHKFAMSALDTATKKYMSNTLGEKTFLDQAVLEYTYLEQDCA